MAPRQRKGKSRGLPPNTYARHDARTGRTYYSYQGPDGTRYGLGTDRAEAIRQANDANVRRASAPDELWQRITQASTPTVAEWADTFEAACRERGQAANTARTRRSHLNRIRGAIGHINLADLTTRHCAEVLEELREAGKARTAQAIRSTLRELLREAIAAGHIERNVADATKAGRVQVQRERLTLEKFLEIHAAALTMPDPWIARAMELAIVSGQSREVIAAARFDDIADGTWWCHRGKTDARIAIPTDLTLEATGWSLDSVVRACRDRVVSRHLIHHSRARTKSQPGDPVFVDTISRSFSRARTLAACCGENPPTFHEIRSLAERLYAAQGVDTQALLGHRDPRTTALYKDVRGSEWITVRV